jgi:hypothetical protein
MKAKRIKDVSGNFRGSAQLWKFDPPLENGEFEYAIVSGISAPHDTGVPETFIFGCNEEGEVATWLELEGSFQGEVNHVKAIENAGYIVEDEG